jgi:hypothetical protein
VRKALLVVVLIAASFAGGAVVNGPGLRWAQACVLQRMGIDGVKPTEILAADSIDTTASAAAEAEGIPGRPIEPLVLDAPEVTDKPKAKTDAPGAKADPSPIAETKDPRTAPAAVEPLEVAQAPAPASAPAPLPLPVDSLSVTPPVERDGPIRQASLPGKEAEAAEDSAPPVTPSPATVSALPGDWASVRRAMKSLGVTRYGLDGDPGGRVRFHCVIPVAGRRAVGQYFEADGDDDLQAAQAALKRVALWRATEADTALPPRARTP